uniref:GRAM domain-containing protein n=1 Tax=Calidris pygmaea TaxID=425635 RepID=A0A8C3PTC4_9CHAR
MAGKLRRRGRGVLEEKPWQSLEERGSTQMEHPVLARWVLPLDPPSPGTRPLPSCQSMWLCVPPGCSCPGERTRWPLVGQPLGSPPPRLLLPDRSKTCDPSFCKGMEEAAATQGHPSPSLSKRATSYRKAFGELAERDVLLGCFSCAWQREVPYHGRLYVSSRHVCFHSSLLLKDIKAVVPVASISALKKTNTALLVPNALSIRTAEGEKFLFVSLRQREATYQLLKSVCKHLKVPTVPDWGGAGTSGLCPHHCRAMGVAAPHLQHPISSPLVQDNGWSPPDSPNTKEILRKSLVKLGNGRQEVFPVSLTGAGGGTG